MNTSDIGRKAEAEAATYLQMRGYKIVEQNWRRSSCEIDIVANKDKIIYFVEVKYRRSDRQGGGLDYVTATKLRQMQRAAELWVEEYKWKGDYRLAAIELMGPSFTVTSFIDSII